MTEVRNRIVGVVPARLASTRLPRKMLRQIAGKPLLGWVVEAAQRCSSLDELIVATDAQEIADYCLSRGFCAEMTSPDLPSGTDRVHAISQRVAGDIFVNIQGDEPLLHPDQLQTLTALFADPNIAVGTLKTPCAPHDVANPNAVKVVADTHGRALYFSRAAIPHDRDRTGSAAFWKHLGFYAYRRAALEQFPALPPSRLEAAERLEQLRFLEAGVPIYVAATEHDSIGVDTEADLLAVEKILLARG
jgi:3-deoxy-manno-octulosonate cytidylyltransferase (CMP-KDO synthetase)